MKNCIPEKNSTEWVMATLKAIETVQGWAVIGRAIIALEQLVEKGSGRTGAEDGYNWTAVSACPSYASREWEINGGCGYGSACHITRGSIMVASCGGHWITAHHLPDGRTCVNADGEESHQSWGDCPWLTDDDYEGESRNYDDLAQARAEKIRLAHEELAGRDQLAEKIIES